MNSTNLMRGDSDSHRELVDMGLLYGVCCQKLKSTQGSSVPEVDVSVGSVATTDSTAGLDNTSLLAKSGAETVPYRSANGVDALPLGGRGCVTRCSVKCDGRAPHRDVILYRLRLMQTTNHKSLHVSAPHSSKHRSDADCAPQRRTTV